MLNGLDLFSGIGGLAQALSSWVRPVAYCEIDPYAAAVLLSRIDDGHLPFAPIWDDVQTLQRAHFHGSNIDIIYGGFPCQDISIAGRGGGLAGERSGLFKEIVRLCGELRPPFVFLENVPAIATRGGREVVGAFTQIGYDCRWTTVSAEEVGANHKRERWFLLAYSQSNYARRLSVRDEAEQPGSACSCKDVSNADSQQYENHPQTQQRPSPTTICNPFSSRWWATEPNVGRVAYGVLRRVDRIKCLGNAVVPIQAQTAFKILMGIN